MKITATSLVTCLALAGIVLSSGACGGGPETGSRPGAQTTPPTPSSQPPQPSQAQGQKDLPDSAYQVEWGAFEVPATLKPGTAAPVAVSFKNTSSSNWPSGAGTTGQLYTVRLSHRWLKAPGPGKGKLAKPEQVVGFDTRVELPQVVKPGESVTLQDTLQAPAKRGRYLVEFELVHEGVAWFSGKGGAIKQAPVKVE